MQNDNSKLKNIQKMNKEEKNKLLEIARKTIEAELNHTKYEPSNIPDSFKMPAATFITITKSGQLRGCIGTLEAHEPLINNLKHNALMAAFNDYRFPPLQKNEIDQIKIEISILSKPEKIKFNNTDGLLDAIQPNIDGIILEADGYSATYLPQVWQDLPNKKDFLASLCQKAGLNSNRWQQENLTIKKYQVIKFSE